MPLNRYMASQPAPRMSTMVKSLPPDDRGRTSPKPTVLKVDHGHVEGIQNLHVLQQPEPRRTQQQQAGQGNRRFPEAPMRVGGNPPVHQGLLDRPGSSQDQPTRRNNSIVPTESIHRREAAANAERFPETGKTCAGV